QRGVTRGDLPPPDLLEFVRPDLADVWLAHGLARAVDGLLSTGIASSPLVPNRARRARRPRYQSSLEGSRAPPASRPTWPQTISGSTAAGPTQVPKPQSVPAMTFSRPTSRA